MTFLKYRSQVERNCRVCSSVQSISNKNVSPDGYNINRIGVFNAVINIKNILKHMQESIKGYFINDANKYIVTPWFL